MSPVFDGVIVLNDVIDILHLLSIHPDSAQSSRNTLRINIINLLSIYKVIFINQNASLGTAPSLFSTHPITQLLDLQMSSIPHDTLIPSTRLFPQRWARSLVQLFNLIVSSISSIPILKSDPFSSLSSPCTSNLITTVVRTTFKRNPREIPLLRAAQNIDFWILCFLYAQLLIPCCQIY